MTDYLQKIKANNYDTYKRLQNSIKSHSNPMAVNINVVPQCNRFKTDYGKMLPSANQYQPTPFKQYETIRSFDSKSLVPPISRWNKFFRVNYAPKVLNNGITINLAREYKDIYGFIEKAALTNMAIEANAEQIPDEDEREAYRESFRQMIKEQMKTSSAPFEKLAAEQDEENDRIRKWQYKQQVKEHRRARLSAGQEFAPGVTLFIPNNEENDDNERFASKAVIEPAFEGGKGKLAKSNKKADTMTSEELRNARLAAFNQNKSKDATEAEDEAAVEATAKDEVEDEVEAVDEAAVEAEDEDETEDDVDGDAETEVEDEVENNKEPTNDEIELLNNIYSDAKAYHWKDGDDVQKFLVSKANSKLDAAPGDTKKFIDQQQYSRYAKAIIANAIANEFAIEVLEGRTISEYVNHLKSIRLSTDKSIVGNAKDVLPHALTTLNDTLTDAMSVLGIMEGEDAQLLTKSQKQKGTSRLTAQNKLLDQVITVLSEVDNKSGYDEGLIKSILTKKYKHHFGEHTTHNTTTASDARLFFAKKEKIEKQAAKAMQKKARPKKVIVRTVAMSPPPKQKK